MARRFKDLFEAALRSAQLSTSDVAAVAAAKDAVNEAHMMVCDDGTPWDFLEYEGQWAVQPGHDVYHYDSIVAAMGLGGNAIREVVHLVDDTTGGRPLRSMSWGALEGMVSGTDFHARHHLHGPPERWAQWRRRLRVYPVPDREYTLAAFVRLQASTLVADSDEVLLPDSFASAVIVPYAASILLEMEGGPEALQAANRLLSRYEANLRRMLVAHGSARVPTFTVVEPSTFVDLDEMDWWHAV